jgi:hypothetical protein
MTCSIANMSVKTSPFKTIKRHLTLFNSGSLIHHVYKPTKYEWLV